MIELYEVTKSFGSRKAVDNLSLTVGKGEFFGFLGPNGAGKTTTIKIMTGLLRPDSGTARICGFDMNHDSRNAKMQTGYVPDLPYLYEKLTAREFLEFTGGLYNIAQAKLQPRIEWLLELFDMNGWADRRCEEYSHGMRQKVVFSAALVHDPKVLIIDEPMVGLDPQSMRLIKDMLKLLAGQGTTIFVSTHLLTVAEELCDRIGIVNRGRLVAIGTLQQLRKAAVAEGENLEGLFLHLTGGPRPANLPPDAVLE